MGVAFETAAVVRVPGRVAVLGRKMGVGTGRRVGWRVMTAAAAVPVIVRMVVAVVVMVVMVVAVVLMFDGADTSSVRMAVFLFMLVHMQSFPPPHLLRLARQSS